MSTYPDSQLQLDSHKLLRACKNLQILLSRKSGFDEVFEFPNSKIRQGAAICRDRHGVTAWYNLAGSWHGKEAQFSRQPIESAIRKELQERRGRRRTRRRNYVELAKQRMRNWPKMEPAGPSIMPPKPRTDGARARCQSTAGRAAIESAPKTEDRRRTSTAQDHGRAVGIRNRGVSQHTHTRLERVALYDQKKLPLPSPRI